MDILFMGTPDFAASALKAVLESGYHVVGAVTQPDKPKGRGHKLTPPAVKVLALENKIPVYQPVTLKDGALQPILDELQPDIIIVVAYGKILPPYIISYPKYGCINVHASLLPKYRGAAPIQWAVINGEKTTGITTMQMDGGIDTGDILLMQEIKIKERETAAQLFDRLAVLGGEVLVETLHAIENGTAVRIPQDHTAFTYAPMISKELAKINWTKSAKELSDLICGMNAWPLAYTTYHNDTVKIIEALPEYTCADGDCGEVLGYDNKKGLKIKCGQGVLYIQKVQFAGNKKMSIHDYLRGHSIETGTKFE